MPDLESVIRSSVDAARDSFTEEGSGDESVDSSADVDNSEQIDTGEAVVEGETPPVSEESGQTSDTVVDPAAIADDPFAKEHGLKEPKPGERENRIPYTRVKKIVENAERKLVEKALGVPIAAGVTVHDAITQHVARIPELETKIQAYETELGNSNTVLDIMEHDVPRFLNMLLHVHPEYAQYINQNGAQEPQQPAVEPSAGMPPPDVDLGERGKTYSVDGLQKVLMWNAQQVREQTLAEVDKRYKPIATSYEAEQRIQAELPRMRAKIADAEQRWKGFKEHKAEIFELLGRVKGLTLHEAYIDVINAKHDATVASLTADEAKMRAKLLAEIKAAPASTSTTPGTKPTTVSTGPRSIEDTIREAIRKVK